MNRYTKQRRISLFPLTFLYSLDFCIPSVYFSTPAGTDGWKEKKVHWFFFCPWSACWLVLPLLHRHTHKKENEKRKKQNILYTCIICIFERRQKRTSKGIHKKTGHSPFSLWIDMFLKSLKERNTKLNKKNTKRKGKKGVPSLSTFLFLLISSSVFVLSSSHFSVL